MAEWDRVDNATIDTIVPSSIFRRISLIECHAFNRVNGTLSSHNPDLFGQED